jgi:hypothetical protein
MTINLKKIQYSMEYNVAKTCWKKTNNITKSKCLHFQKETKKQTTMVVVLTCKKIKLKNKHKEITLDKTNLYSQRWWVFNKRKAFMMKNCMPK